MIWKEVSTQSSLRRPCKHCEKGEIARNDSIFKRPVLQTRENQGLFGKGLKMKFQLNKMPGLKHDMEISLNSDQPASSL